MSKEEKEYILAIGKQIKAIRQSKDIAQKDLAYICELDISTMNRIESGVYIPRITTLKKIAIALNIPISQIVDIK